MRYGLLVRKLHFEGRRYVDGDELGGLAGYLPDLATYGVCELIDGL